MRRNRTREEFLAASKGTGGGASPEKLKGPEELDQELNAFVAQIYSPKTRELFAARLAAATAELDRDDQGRIVINDRAMALIDLHYEWIIKARPEAVIRSVVWPVIRERILAYSHELRAAFDARDGSPDMVPEHRRIFERYTKLCAEYGVKLEDNPHDSPIMKLLREEKWLPKEG